MIQGGDMSNFLTPAADTQGVDSCCGATGMAEAFCTHLSLDCPRHDSTGSTRGTVFVGRRHETATHPVSGSGISSGGGGGAWRSILPSRSKALTPRLVGGDLTHSCHVRAGVGQGPDALPIHPVGPFISLYRRSGTAENLASISGAGLAATEGWRLPAGIGAGTLQCLAM